MVSGGGAPICQAGVCLHSLPISAGNSLSAVLDGKATLTFLNRAEDYTLTMPYAHCKGERLRVPHPEAEPGWLRQGGRLGSEHWSLFV